MREMDITDILRGKSSKDCQCCAYGACECACGVTWPEQVAVEAADEIDRLRAELAEARRLLDEARITLHGIATVTPKSWELPRSEFIDEFLPWAQSRARDTAAKIAAPVPAQPAAVPAEVARAVQILRQHNQWRRGADNNHWQATPYSPAELGRAIDTVCDHVTHTAQPDVLKRATEYAHDIVTWLHRDHYSDNKNFEPFGDLLGLLSQIDNMICGWKEPQPAVPTEHVAWLRYNDHGGRKHTTLHLCDSDAPGAFRVYREVPAQPADIAKIITAYKCGMASADCINQYAHGTQEHKAFCYGVEDKGHLNWQAAQSAQPAVPDDVAKDAARYRFLRSDGRCDVYVFEHYLSRKELDAAIDAAIISATEGRSNG